MRALFLVGRAIFWGFFVLSGIRHFQRMHNMRQYAASKGVPAAQPAVQLTGLMLLAGGLSLIAGRKPRRGLAMLVGVLVPITLQMHRFWEEQDPGNRQAEMSNFMKNMALVGAALTMTQIREPWPASLDAARIDEEMFVRLGGRDLHALPA